MIKKALLLNMQEGFCAKDIQVIYILASKK
jgi:hypothetical protein